MDLTNIKQLFRNKEEYFDKEVTIGGWVRGNRDSKSFGFLVINDGTFFEALQVVYDDKLENFDKITKLNIGSAVIAKGKHTGITMEEHRKITKGKWVFL